MESSIGWIDLSATALQRLRQDLEQGSDGVVDEMGVLAIHSGYADRFFPGTSVLHKRVRYSLFTCWNYLCLNRIDEAPTAKAKKEAAEDWVRRQLKSSNQEGIIGARVDRPAQPVDFIYWTALKAWGLYRGPERSVLLAKWTPDYVHRVRNHIVRDEDVWEQPKAAFLAPEPPHYWLRPRPREEITFLLKHDEAEFLLKRLESMNTCLLSTAASLSRKLSPDGDTPWDDTLIRAAADEMNEMAVLHRARLASAVGHVIRALYAALVEHQRNETENKKVLSAVDDALHYRNYLEGLFHDGETFDSIRELEIELLNKDLPLLLPEGLLKIIRHVKDRVTQIRRPSDINRFLLDDSTLDLFTREESRRKNRRARLPSDEFGKERRQGLNKDTLHPGSIDYRWPIVYSLLQDLHDGLRSKS